MVSAKHREALDTAAPLAVYTEERSCPINKDEKIKDTNVVPRFILRDLVAYALFDPCIKNLIMIQRLVTRDNSISKIYFTEGALEIRCHQRGIFLLQHNTRYIMSASASTTPKSPNCLKPHLAKQPQTPVPHEESHRLERADAGGIAGAFTYVCLLPLETIKTKFQTREAYEMYRNAFDVIAKWQQFS
ncbi:Mitochondrial carrier domain containing protein [Parasponia andersonii]|uniref:Mitochondrial carrier domain containing protein n=1 Tax=Parasponia andersonii TaxID=3476 RepID=A0A2P5DSN1_PARAD|nr:Mitochondrial carrier domain containing protein [Parasponia andersonii]